LIKINIKNCQSVKSLKACVRVSLLIAIIFAQLFTKYISFARTFLN